MADEFSLEEALAAGETDILEINSDLRTINVPSGYIFGVFNDKDVLPVLFKMNKTYDTLDMSTFQIRINFMNAADQTSSYIVTDKKVDGDTIYFSWLLGREVFVGEGTVKFVVCLRKFNTDGTVDKEFNTTIARSTVLNGLEADDPESDPYRIIGQIDSIEILLQCQEIQADVDTKVETIEDLYEKIKLAEINYGAPFTAATASEMTNRSRVYVYTGSESGYNNGHWYYHNGTDWTDGGTYQSTGVNTDKTLTVPDMAADAKTVGDKLTAETTARENAVTELKADLSDIKPSVYKPAISSTYITTSSNYYRLLDTEPSTSKRYAVKITCATSGNHTFQIGIAGSASSMHDTLGTFNMSANVPMMIYGYTPSGTGYKYVRNTGGDQWDVKFCDVYEDLADDAVNAFTEVSSLNTSVNVLNGKFTQSIGKNRFSGQNLSTGYYNTQGSIVANSDWTLADYTDVEGFDNVTFSATVNGTRGLFALSFIAFFDSEKVFIEQINSATSVEIPETAKYIRFSWRTVPVDLQVENGTTFSEYESYTVFNEIVNSPYIKEIVKPYDEIRWAVFGDSMTEKNAKATFSYYDYVREDLGCSIVNYGASGTGYKAREGENLAFYQRMLTVDPDDFDVLTIFGSVNDAGQTIGNITDTGTTTLCGCINTTIDNFYSIAPFKTIGLVTPPPTRSLNYTAEDTTWIDAYVEAIISIAKRRSIPVMDMYHESGLRPYNEDFKVEYYTENGSQDVGVHPNSKAHKQFLYPKFRQFFEKLV